MKKLKNNKCAILVENMSKDFILYGDKANTLKERIIRIGKNKKDVIHVLKNFRYIEKQKSRKSIDCC